MSDCNPPPAEMILSKPRKRKSKRGRRVDLHHLQKRGKVYYLRHSKLKTRSLNTTVLKEARLERDRILGQLSQAERLGFARPEPKLAPLFSDVYERAIESRSKNRDLRESSRAVFERNMRNWCLPYFARLRMSEINGDHIEDFIHDLQMTISPKTSRTLAQATIKNVVTDLCTLMRLSIRRRWFQGANPFDQLDRLPSAGRGRQIKLTIDESTRLLAELSGELSYKCALALHTGLRWGEVHGLAWDDLDLDASPATLSVERSWTGAPKNEASRATLTLGSTTVALLRRWRSEQGERTQYVFPNGDGQLRTQAARSDAAEIKRAAVRAGIDKNVFPHVFRHTCATWAWQGTKDPKKVQRLMRHASFMTSMGYVHDDSPLVDVIEQLPKPTPSTLKLLPDRHTIVTGR